MKHLLKDLFSVEKFTTKLGDLAIIRENDMKVSKQLYKLKTNWRVKKE